MSIRCDTNSYAKSAESAIRSLQNIEENGGDDGTRTRGLCRDSEMVARNSLESGVTDGLF
jgi:hypothetical protein